MSSDHGSDGHDGPLAESAAWNITAYLMAGLLGFGLPGWLLDQWLGTAYLTLVGLLVGMAAAFVPIWFRYGTDRS
ncbi:MAG: AtpZ/AtpI family protein [Actinomycetota bacterium]|nr:AtpZ/AtpI family protein [Actinomycetota bacterium]